LTLFFSSEVRIAEKVDVANLTLRERHEMLDNSKKIPSNGSVTLEKKSTKTTIPFVKNNEFDYAWLVSFIKEEHRRPFTWIVFVIIVIFIVTSVSNGANLTDGLDGLATGTSAIIGTALAILAYVSSNIIYAKYFNIMYIPGTEELVVSLQALLSELQ
jgi:phospho-N-acetylmuramoyl-pentapeptide-transferase